MDLRQLEYTVAVVDHGGFSAAARALGVSQPSLSSGVRSLESGLGVALFARLGRSVRATDAGEQVVALARQVLLGAAQIERVAEELTGLARGRLDLTCLPTLAVDPLVGLVGAFRRRHPAVVVHVHEAADAAAVGASLREGRAELGLTDLRPAIRSLRRVALHRQELRAVLPPGHRPTATLRPEDLARLPLVATPPGTSTRRLLDEFVGRARRQATIVVETASREALVPLVLAGAGATVLPANLADAAGALGAVVRPLERAPVRRVGWVHRTAPLSAPARAMVELSIELSTPGATAPSRRRG